MKTFKIFITIVLVGITCQNLFSQITQFEFSIGNNKTDFSFLSVKPLDKKKAFSFTTIAFFQKHYFEKDLMFDAVGVQTTAHYHISKSISFGPALYFNSAEGFKEKLSITFSKRAGKFTFTIIPAISYLSSLNIFSTELFIGLQYKQPFKKGWDLLTYTKILTDWRKMEKHNRSYQYFRIGLSKNNTDFGFSISLDQYGKTPISKQSFGIFFRKTFLGT